jgi:pyridoxine 5-phosphate synthase
MAKLSVNVNKIATLRNARGGDVPNVLKTSLDILRFGAEGITVHPRPDGRHIRYQDVKDLSRLVRQWNRNQRRQVEFNVEGFPDSSYMKLVESVRPHQATLVPDPPDAITSNAGWRLAANEKSLAKTLSRLRKAKVRSSLFIDVFEWSASEHQALRRLNPDRVELYTERFARDYVTKSRAKTTAQYAKVARDIEELGIEINAGHDLNLQNIRYLVKHVPQVVECSIGHALIAEALYFGFKKTVRSYLSKMKARP